MLFGKQRRVTSLLILVCCLVAAGWAALNAWNYRDFVNPDGVSYLDMARQALASGPASLVNAHWSPLYPALLALSQIIVPPTLETEFPIAHVVNAMTHVLAATAFAWLVSELTPSASGSGARWLAAARVILAFCLFLDYTNADILPLAITPDLLLAATAFAAAALFLRLCRRGRVIDAVTLGVVLAFGFYTKSIMLPAGCALCLMLLWRGSRSLARPRHAAITGGVMLALSLPQIAAVSLKVGHISIGETGALNYLWWVQGVQPFAGWTGSPHSDELLHGPRILNREPEVLEFGEPIPGTYPLWYDPAYWHAGAKLHFDWQKQLAALRRTAEFYRSILPQVAWPLAGVVFVALLAFIRGTPPDALKISLLVWPIAVLVMYALLFNEMRYVAPWFVLFFAVAFAALETRFVVLQILVILAVAGFAVVPRLEALVAATRALAPTRGPTVDMQLVDDLRAVGVRPGDKIAIVGSGFAHYYAHLAGVRIVAQISDPAAFWSLGDEQAAEVERTIARSGVKVLIGPGRPSIFQPESWVIGERTGCSILPLQLTTD